MSSASRTEPAEERGLTDDGFLGGRLRILQPARGHRSGMDAVFLAAATPAKGGDTVLDAGAGVGVAGLCVLARVAGARLTSVEIDPVIVSLARENAARNGFGAETEIVEIDVTTTVSSRLRSSGFDHVIANPPFYDSGTVSPAPERQRAHQVAEGGVAAWIRFLHAQAAEGAWLTMIHRPAALHDLLAACEGRFGSITVFPLFPRIAQPALRILVQARKGRRSELVLLPGMILHEPSGAFTAEAEAVLRGGGALRL